MPENVLTRSWSAEDLAKIGKDNHLTTLFMNQVNFEKQTIKLYPYQLRKFYAARYTGGEARFYATDLESAEWFFRQRWGLKPERLVEISGAAFAATKPLTTTPIRVPKATLEAPLFDCPRCCVDKEGIGVVLNSMDVAIIDTEGKLKLQSQNPLLRSTKGSQAGPRELGLLRAVRDSLAELPFCKEKREKELVKPPPKKAQAPKEVAVKESTKKPAKPAKVTKEEEYDRPFARVTNVKGALLRYEDAQGKLLPKNLWPATV